MRKINMKTYPLLGKTPVKNYTLKAAKYIFSVTPALTISLIAITVFNGLAATVNASLTHITLNSMSSMLNNNQDFRFIIGVVALMVLAMIVFPILSSLEELLMALDGEYKALFDLQAQWYVKQDKKNV